MSVAETATSAKVPLDGVNAAQNAAQAGDQASSILQGTSATSDTMAGAANVLGHTDNLFSLGGYFQALGVLFLIIAILFVALCFLRRKGGIKLLTGQGDLLVESRIALGAKKQLIVVRFLNKRVLLGVTDQQITMLTELPTNEDHTAHNSRSPKNTVDFKAHFANETQTEPKNSG